MNEASPAVRAVIAELSQAVRRDHARRVRHAKAIRIGGFSALGLVALSSAALAAGGAFREIETVTPVGEVQLPRNLTIQAVDSFPEFVGRATPNGFATSTGSAAGGRYIYHVTGGVASGLGCGFATPPTNNIYIRSTRQLTSAEIESMLLPNGELAEDKQWPRPAGVTETSNGCPNPGVAGQPGTPNESPKPGKAAVATPTSGTTRILIRKRTLVPVNQAPSPTPTQPAATSSSSASSSPTDTSTRTGTATLTLP